MEVQNRDDRLFTVFRLPLFCEILLNQMCFVFVSDNTCPRPTDDSFGVVTVRSRRPPGRYQNAVEGETYDITCARGKRLPRNETFAYFSVKCGPNNLLTEEIPEHSCISG